MTRLARCDFAQLERTVTSQFRCGEQSLHGPTHCRRVERNGLLLARQTGAHEMGVRLFAWFHDSLRVNESHDPGHGRRGAAFASLLRGKAFQLPNPEFQLLLYACTWHTDEDHTDDPTLGTCWDADRLDLGRVGIVPIARFLNTGFAKHIANSGGFGQLG